ncbi:hypothetical protein WMF11_43605 [Sorangium sp. So ce295]|uniref:hypothetical protein n=1 Tax=Sorangium sp. So ce295 TaxID=3133295 RepID=UPI003F5EC8E9
MRGAFWHKFETNCAAVPVRQARGPEISCISALAHALLERDGMKRTSSVVALSVMSLVPLCMTPACGPTETSSPGTTSSGESTGPEQTSACEPRQAGISAEFEVTVEAWPDEGFDSYEVNMAAPCQVEAASSTSRSLACTDKDGVAHGVTIAVQDSDILGAVPESGPVFLRVVHFTDIVPVIDHQWFEVRAGSDITGALLAGGVRGSNPWPDTDVEPYFAPIRMAMSPEEGCPEELRKMCVAHRRGRIDFWIDELPAGSILDGHEGEVGASGAYRVIVGASVDRSMGGDPDLCGGDDAEYLDDLRILIGARAPEPSVGAP